MYTLEHNIPVQCAWGWKPTILAIDPALIFAIAKPRSLLHAENVRFVYQLLVGASHTMHTSVIVSVVFFLLRFKCYLTFTLGLFLTSIAY